MEVYQLYSCVWEITLACPFSCRYCGSKAGKARKNELTTEECISVAFQLGDLGCQRVSLIGGEVFMRKDWKVITDALIANGIRVNIITNGFLFTEEILNELRSTGIESVSVSVDGPRDVHDRYRQEGSFDRALKAVDTLSDAGIPVSVITTLNGDNAGRLPELRDELVKHRIFAWQIQACSPMGNASGGAFDYIIDPYSVIRFVEDNMNSVPFAMGVADNIGYFSSSEGYIRGSRSGKAFYRGCSAGISVIGIDSIGNVRGCESMYDEHFNEGNVRERRLSDIWYDEDAFSYNRKFDPSMLTGKCAECEMGIYCAGGCRSFNFFAHGKLYEAPRCARLIEEELTQVR